MRLRRSLADTVTQGSTTARSVRVAVVTGAARGIGAALTRALAQAGWCVLAVDSCADDPALPYAMSTPDELATVVAGCDSGDRVVGHLADVRDHAALGRAVAEAEGRWGGLDAAVAAAGVIAGGLPHREVPPEQERAVLEVDLYGVLNLARAAVPALLRRPVPRTGRFVVVASAAAARGLPQLAAYCAAKAGVVGFVRSLAVELGESGVTANAVSPGSTDTAILAESARLYGLADVGEFASHHPIGRLVQAEEVAAAIAFLLSPSAAAITGAVVPVDGGMTL